MSNMNERIFMALGEVSMCWSETPKGVFDSNNAARIGDKLVEDIKTDLVEMLTWASKNNYEPIHDGRWCKEYMSVTISSEELLNKWLENKEKEENEN